MSYDTAITDLRQMISDTEKNKVATRKKLIGNVDGENTSFVLYDKRIYEDTLKVYVANVEADFTLDDPIQGLITLAAAPDKNTKVEASYYWQFWLDEELINFLNKGAETVSQFSATVPDQAYLQIPPGLKLPALNVAAGMSIRALIQYLVNRRHSEEFNIEQDGNDDSAFSQMISALQKSADSYMKDGLNLRDDFYKRQGKRNAPAFGIKVGQVRNYGARR